MARRPEAFISALRGKRVSHVWRGYGSALFLEFGELTKTRKLNGKSGHPVGDLSLMVQWSWRVENKNSILGGSWSNERRWPSLFKRLIGSRVKSVELFGRLPEIAVALSNGLRVVSFMTADGQPSWAVIAHKPSNGSLSVKRGKLHVGTNGS
jgi:hypothetical protein